MIDEDELARFEVEVRSFLDRSAPRRGPARERRWGEGSDGLDLLGGAGTGSAAERVAAQAWRARVFDAGFGWLSGPIADGGAGLDPRYEQVYAGLEAEYGVPDQAVFRVARGMVSPAIVSHGSAEIKHRFLRGIHRGEIICCQLLSEPEAGSDLAGIRTSAVRDGDDWVVNGQKVWSSNAHVASIGQLLARTDPDASKHGGLTMFLLPMDSPGIEVRPLRQMNGEAHFNEVFFDNVRVADANRVGDVGGGWRAVLTTLMNERLAVANRSSAPHSDPTTRLLELAKILDAGDDPVMRQRLADVYVHDRLLRYLRLRQEAAMAAGKQPGPEGSIAKLLFTTQLRRIGAVAASLLGPGFAADTGTWGAYTWSRFVTTAPGIRIAGGTDEIQRNTIAERTLGLPRHEG